MSQIDDYKQAFIEAFEVEEADLDSLDQVTGCACVDAALRPYGT